jgi:hypothetical protein
MGALLVIVTLVGKDYFQVMGKFLLGLGRGRVVAIIWQGGAQTA